MRFARMERSLISQCENTWIEQLSDELVRRNEQRNGAKRSDDLKSHTVKMGLNYRF